MPGVLGPYRRVECLECSGVGNIEGIGQRKIKCRDCHGRGSFTFTSDEVPSTESDKADIIQAVRFMRGRFEIMMSYHPGTGYSIWHPWPSREPMFESEV